MKKILSQQNYPVLLVLLVVTILLSTPIYYHRITFPVHSDYGSHIRFAIEFLQNRTLEPATMSHPVLQLMLVFLYWVTRSKLSFYDSMILIQIVFHVLMVMVIYFWLGQSSRKHWDWIRAFVSITLTFVGPIVLLAFFDQNLYFGYIGMANYHNPTIHMLKPLALISIIFSFRAIEGKQSSWWVIFLASFFMLFATWIKPNYALVILPGLAIVGSIRLIQKQRLDWRMLFWGFFFPALISLFIQWLIAYVYGDPEESIVFAPFQVEAAFSDWLLLKFFLSSAFPLFVMFVARKELLRDSSLFLGWVTFLIGMSQNYFLAEGGERFHHANFRWSGQIVLFLLFVITARWFLREKIMAGQINLWEKITAYSIYAAHLAGGIAYYIYCMVSVTYR